MCVYVRINAYTCCMNNRDYIHYPVRHHVYLLRCPTDGKVKYVGCTDSPLSRYQSHYYRGDTSPKSEWLEELKSMGRKPYMEIVESFIFRHDAEAFEKLMLSEFKDKDIHNVRYPKKEEYKNIYKLDSMRVNTYFPEDMRKDIEAFQKLAEKERRSVSWYFQELVKEKAKEYKQLKTKTKKA